MGAGIALAIKQQYPKAWLTYRKEYEENGLSVGNCQFVDINANVTVVNALTQERMGRNKAEVYVSYDGIAMCFIRIAKFIEQKKVELKEQYPEHCIIINLDFPMIGAGLGGGDWAIISKIIDDCIPNSLANKRLFTMV